MFYISLASPCFLMRKTSWCLFLQGIPIWFLGFLGSRCSEWQALMRRSGRVAISHSQVTKEQGWVFGHQNVKRRYLTNQLHTWWSKCEIHDLPPIRIMVMCSKIENPEPNMTWRAPLEVCGSRWFHHPMDSTSQGFPWPIRRNKWYRRWLPDWLKEWREEWRPGRMDADFTEFWFFWVLLSFFFLEETRVLLLLSNKDG